MHAIITLKRIIGFFEVATIGGDVLASVWVFGFDHGYCYLYYLFGQWCDGSG